MSPLLSALTPFAFAIACLILPVGLGLAIARAVRRRGRIDERDRVRRLATLMRGHVRGRVPVIALTQAVRAASESEFWAALEARLPRLTRAERRRLGRQLERGRHVAAERRALLGESPLRREMAARRLGLLPCARSRRALRSTLSAAPEPVAFAAARSLARDSDLRALEWLLARPGLLPHRTANQWAQLLRAFGRRALPQLSDAVQRGIADPRVLRAAVDTLGHGHHAPAAPAIERLLAHESTDLRVAAARALGRIQAGPCSDALLRALRDSEWPVRAQAAWALGRIDRDEAVPALASCLTDKAWWVRRHAAYALAALHERGAIALRLAASSSHDRYAREMADEALQSLGRSA